MGLAIRYLTGFLKNHNFFSMGGWANVTPSFGSANFPVRDFTDWKGGAISPHQFSFLLLKFQFGQKPLFF